VRLEREFRYLTRIGRENGADFDFGRVLRRRWRRSGRRVESDQADGAKFGVGTELALRRVPVAGQVVIVRAADQLDKDDHRRRKDRGDRARPASGGFGSADQNRSFGRLLGPIVIRNAVAVKTGGAQVATGTHHATLKSMQGR
jgi:hypothetical protein